MKTRHKIPAVFSIYMADVLCCALGCVILLWQLYHHESEEQTARNEEVRRENEEVSKRLDVAKKENDEVSKRLDVAKKENDETAKRLETAKLALGSLGSEVEA